MKSKILIFISIVIILGVGIKFTLGNTCFGIENISTFLQNKLNKQGIQNIEVEHEKIINNKYVVIFTYTDKNFTRGIGFSTFEIKSLNRYKYEKFAGNNLSINERSVITTDENGNMKNYWVLYGMIGDGMPNKYNITYSGKSDVEEFPRNKIFVKYYDSDSLKLELVKIGNGCNNIK